MTALFSLERLLTRTIAAGSLTPVGPDARIRRFVRGAPEATVEIEDRGLAQKMALSPDIALGEAYMDGSFVVESGDIYDFFDLCFANFGRGYGHWLWRVLGEARRLQKRLARSNSLHAAPTEISHHHDLSDELYRLFLDGERQYSCAYYRTQDDTLEQAQEQKLAHVAAKLSPRPGQRVLDIGCGWGGLALHLTRVADVEVTGLTLSQAQGAYARQRARETGLDNRVRFEVQDYRAESDRYDRIVSVGMFEHVGYGRYHEFFDKLRELLADDGIAGPGHDRKRRRTGLWQRMDREIHFSRRTSAGSLGGHAGDRTRGAHCDRHRNSPASSRRAVEDVATEIQGESGACGGDLRREMLPNVGVLPRQLRGGISTFRSGRLPHSAEQAHRDAAPITRDDLYRSND